MNNSEIVQRIGELVSATSVDTVLAAMAQWLRECADTIGPIDPDNTQWGSYRAAAVKLDRIRSEL